VYSLLVLNVNRPVLLPVIHLTIISLACTIKMFVLMYTVSWNMPRNNRFKRKNAQWLLHV